MSAKAVREYHGKRLLARHISALSPSHAIESRSALVTGSTDIDALPTDEPWLLSTALVVKPDQLIKRRGKAGLVGINLSYDEVKEWIEQRMNREITIEGTVTGKLDTFIVEPFIPHDESDEHYVCIQSSRDGDVMLFCKDGGVDVGNVDAKANKLEVMIDQDLAKDAILAGNLLNGVPVERKEKLCGFLAVLFQVYRKLHFTYLEINPIVFASDGNIVPLDLAAKIDETAAFLCQTEWGHLDFPAPFGREEFPEEAYIRELDSKTGASLKLTILNHSGRVWTMVAGGGASVVYADTIADSGFGHELANYGEYSGAPSPEHTFEYAKTIISLMTRKRDPRGKILIIGGGIANFTDIAATFTGLIQALEQYQDDLKSHKVSIWVRRAGPNYADMECIECRCRDPTTGTYLNVGGGDGQAGGVSCCTNCTALEGPTVDYRMRYNVSYADIPEESAITNVQMLTTDISPVVGKWKDQYIHNQDLNTIYGLESTLVSPY